MAAACSSQLLPSSGPELPASQPRAYEILGFEGQVDMGELRNGEVQIGHRITQEQVRLHTLGLHDLVFHESGDAAYVSTSEDGDHTEIVDLSQKFRICLSEF